MPAMYRKSFVSLAFFSKTLQILKLNGKKDKVSHFGSFPIPDGLIANYQVQDATTLSEIVKKAWKSLKLAERSVGIVVPEFSTYTKSISLPKLDNQELDEAIRWQSQEFLPVKATDVVMDWKIINEEPQNYRILTAAIRKSILSGYVEAAGKADLFPLVVETPSLSLIRVADGKDRDRLIIYVSQEETVMVVSQAGSIVGSSVVRSSSQREIIDTAMRIISYYQGVKIDGILVGGLGLTQEFLTNIANTLKRQVRMIPKVVAGLTPAQIQEYLIPISLQLKDPAQPEDETTVNLLPKSWVKHYKSKKTDYQLWTLTLMISFVVMVSFLVGVISFMLLSKRSTDINAELSAVNESPSIETFKKIEKINTASKNVLSVVERTVLPQDVVNEIASAKPGGLSLHLYDMNFESGELVVRGVSPNRNALLEFKNNLEGKDNFSSVSLPIASITQETNFDFEIRFIYSKFIPVAVPKIKL